MVAANVWSPQRHGSLRIVGPNFFALYTLSRLGQFRISRYDCRTRTLWMAMRDIFSKNAIRIHACKWISNCKGQLEKGKLSTRRNRPILCKILLLYIPHFCCCWPREGRATLGSQYLVWTLAFFLRKLVIEWQASGKSCVEEPKDVELTFVYGEEQQPSIIPWQ